ncbi:MAG: FmdB family zinc ribbon protein [Candidatus Hydrogenedentota bacterium]
MPLFNFRCKKCGHVMEVLQRGTPTDQLTCEVCGAKDLDKLMCSFRVGGGGTGSSENACPTGTCPLS